jgi:hypothetical protein
VPVPTSSQLSRRRGALPGRRLGAAVPVTDRSTWSTMGSSRERSCARCRWSTTDRRRPGRVHVRALETALGGGRRWSPHPTRAEDPAYPRLLAPGTTAIRRAWCTRTARARRQPSSEYWFDFPAM